MSNLEIENYRDWYLQSLELSVKITGKTPGFFAKRKVEHLIEEAQKYFGSIDDKIVLDIGCGIGLVDSYLKSRFSRIVGVDICREAIRAAYIENPDLSYNWYSGEVLPYPQDYFDISFAINVIHHVSSPKWQYFISEMRRVTKKGGLCFIFDLNLFNPITRLIVSRCTYDKDANLISAHQVKELFHKCSFNSIKSKSIIYFPFDMLFFKKLENILSVFLPFGTQYYVMGIK